MSRRPTLEHTVRGTYHRVATPGEERPLELQLRATLGESLAIRREIPLEGKIWALGLVDGADIRGHAQLLLRERKLIFELVFVADDGNERRFHGETELALRRAVRSVEELVGRIYHCDTEEARVLLRGSFRSAFRILSSLRLG